MIVLFLFILLIVVVIYFSCMKDTKSPADSSKPELESININSPDTTNIKVREDNIAVLP